MIQKNIRAIFICLVYDKSLFKSPLSWCMDNISIKQKLLFLIDLFR